MKTISEVQGRVGDKKTGKREKKALDKKTRDALVSASNLLKGVMNTSNPKSLPLCLDLKRRLEDIEKEYGVSLL